MKGIAFFFEKFFDIRRSEIRKAVLLQAYVFILITTLLIVKPTINSLFLSELTSEALPTAYLLTAVVAVLFSLVYDKILWTFKLNRVIFGTLIFCASLFALFCFLLNYHPDNTGWLYAPYLFVAIFGLLTTSQFWILANMVFNVREAKRLFGFIGSGAIAGGIFGGYLTSILTRFIPSENLLLVAAVLLLACIPISAYLWKHYVHASRVEKPKKEKLGTSPWSMIRKNRLLILITATVGISVIVAKLVDYQYSHFAAEKITNPEKLTAFFGFWFSTLSVVSLLIQLFLSKGILRRFGVGKSLMFLPLGILIGSILLLVIPELWVVVLIKIADGSFKQSLNKAASELTYIPIPLEVRKHTKPFIDIVVDSIATGLAGAILIFLINGLKIPSLYISYINIGLILVWVFLISRIYKAYLTSFRQLLVTEHPKAKKHEEHHLHPADRSVYDTVDRVLRSGKESQVLYMLEEILREPDEHYFSAIRNLLDHPSEHVRALAIENLYYMEVEDLRGDIRGMLNDPSDAVVIDALRYLIHKDHDLHREEILDFEAHSNHKNIHALTLLAVAKEVHTDPHLKEILHLGKRVDALLKNAGEAPWDDKRKIDLIAALEAIGHTHLASHYKEIAKYFSAEDPEIVRAALDGAAEVKDPRFIPYIVKELHDKSVRPQAIEALRAYGPKVVPILRDLVEQQKLDFQDALCVPYVLEVLGTQEAIQVLMEFIDTAEYSVSVKAIEALGRARAENPELQIDRDLIARKILAESRIYLNLLSFLHTQISEQEKQAKTDHTRRVREAREGLITILERRVDGHLNRIFKLLGIHYFEEEVEPILQIAVSGDEGQRANAIEFIDNILESHLRHTLLPIIDAASQGVSYSEELVAKLKLPSYTERECFETLIGRHDLKIKHGVLYLIGQLGDASYASLVERLLDSPFETVRKQAAQVLEGLRPEKA